MTRRSFQSLSRWMLEQIVLSEVNFHSFQSFTGLQVNYTPRNPVEAAKLHLSSGCPSCVGCPGGSQVLWWYQGYPTQPLPQLRLTLLPQSLTLIEVKFFFFFSPFSVLDDVTSSSLSPLMSVCISECCLCVNPFQAVPPLQQSVSHCSAFVFKITAL